MTEKLLPASVDVERLVLGSILLDQELLDEARVVITPDDFSLEKHRRIWRRATELYDGGRHVDRVTVATALEDAGELESVGGLSYLVELDDGLPQLPALSAYVKILKDDATRRRTIFLFDNLIRRAQNRESVQSILESVGDLSLEVAPPDIGKAW